VRGRAAEYYEAGGIAKQIGHGFARIFTDFFKSFVYPCESVQIRG
jgi:hypothetical protein